MITGCTTGTGLVAAKTAAKKGAHVVMLNRKSHLVLRAIKRGCLVVIYDDHRMLKVMNDANCDAKNTTKTY